MVVSAGNSELSLQLRLPGQQLREGSFRVTRMRCWRVTSSVSCGRSGEAFGTGAWQAWSFRNGLQWVREAGRPIGQNELSLIPFLFEVPLPSGGTSSPGRGRGEVRLELAFEYLMSKDRLQWVTITSPQV